MRAWQALSVVLLFLLAAASGARAETIEINGDHGGLLYFYQKKWEALAAKKVNVRITGPCSSACTVLLGYIPRKDICVTPNAALGFHLATMQFATDQLLAAYPDDVKAWINQHGGLKWPQVLWMQVPDIYHFLQKCGT